MQHNVFLDCRPGFRPKIVLAQIYRFPVPITLTETVIQQMTRPTEVVQKRLGSVFYLGCYPQRKTFVFVWKTEFHSNNAQINDTVLFTIGSLFCLADSMIMSTILRLQESQGLMLCIKCFSMLNLTSGILWDSVVKKAVQCFLIFWT